jgi:hypothetical protein
VHLSVIDPFPPGQYDPEGIHPAIWSNVTSTEYRQPPDRRLTVAAYEASECPGAFVEPFAVGQPIPDLPLFLDENYHINVPLEQTYLATWNALPVQIRTLFD